MNLYEKLNRLDDSLVESKRVAKKKKLTESFSTETEWEELDSAETMSDERTWEPLRLWKNKKENRYVIIIGDNYPWEGYANMEFDNEEEAKYEFEAYLDEPYYNTDYEDDYDDDIDEMLTEDVETSKAVKQGFQKILDNAMRSVNDMLPALTSGMVEYTDKYKEYLDKDDKEVVLQNINNLVKYINVELIDNLNKFANQLN